MFRGTLWRNHDGRKARETARLLLVAAILHQALAAAPASASDPARLALFAFELIDTSLQGEIEGISAISAHTPAS